MYGGKIMFGHQDDDQKVMDDVTAAPPVAQAASAPFQASTQSDDHNSIPEQDKPQEDLPAPSPAVSEDHGSDTLLSIKQQALTQLQPLVSHLDQSPEEKFRTLMMMIQASDDQSLLKSAYEAASQISDDKSKAQALLDIVNEINYFTHPQSEN